MQKLIEKILQGFEWVKDFYKTHKHVIVAVIGGTLIGLFLWIGPKYHVSSYRKNFIDQHYWSLTPNERTQLDREMLKAENDARVTLAQILGGIGLLAGLYFTWRNLRINEDGKITDRYSKAIELLGSDKLDVRLGGIYALERIAKDSEKDHWTVIEALTAFVREHSPIKTKKPAQGELFKSEDEEDEDKRLIATDIQAALTVIGRRKWVEQEEDQWLNLTKAGLTMAILYKANLSNADLSEANLSEANLSEANLASAILDGADLSGANLLMANLREANLYRTNLSEAELGVADLRGANLSGANLSGANLFEAYLRDACLVEVILNEAKLYSANLSGATLGIANLSGADLSGANLLGADLAEACNLTWEQIKKAKIDDTTKLPPDLKEKWEAERQKI